MSESCRFESAILEATETNDWTDDLRAHLGTCDDCIAAASVAPWMDRFARLHDRERRLPDPTVVYVKARLLQGAADAGRAARPLDVAQMLAYLVVAGGWAGLLTWRWDLVETWLRGFTPGTLVVSAVRVESLTMSFFAVAFVLASTTVTLALHTILAEE